MTDSSEETAANDWRALLNDITRTRSPGSATEAMELTRRFREAVLRFGSETDDNRALIAAVEVGEVGEVGEVRGAGVPPRLGFRIAGTDMSVSSLLWNAEGCEIPAEVGEAFPELTQSQWDGCLRLVTLMLVAFEGRGTETPS